MFDNIKAFFEKQKNNIIITLIGGLVPFLINAIYDVVKENYISDSSTKKFNWEITPYTNFVLQSIFILITLFVLLQVRNFVVNDIKKSKEQIKQYIKKNCKLKIYDRERTTESAFNTVKETVSQFFFVWIIVWIMWLIFYGGGFFIYSLQLSDHSFKADMVLKTFQQTFDFLNSTAMFAIYIILTSVTVNRKERTENDYTYWEAFLVWIVLFIVFLAGVIIENVNNKHFLAEFLPFYLSIFSTVTFVLVLGKMNSTYLQIPAFFMFILYIYALIQLIIPFSELKDLEKNQLFISIKYIIPYLTLLGKIILMLTICWIAVQRRFIFFVIHRSITIDQTEELLSELNKENVSF